MAAKTPVKATFTGSDVTGLAEFQTSDTIPLTNGGLGVSLSIGSAGQVLKVNGGGSALEFGAVEAVINIDGATDLTSATLTATDLLLASDGGSEGRITLGQIDTLFSGTTKTLTNKTLTSPKIGTNILDTNGNELVVLTATSSAVNEVTLANAATGGAPTITASGETNVGITLAAKGTGVIQLQSSMNPTISSTGKSMVLGF